MKSTGARKVPPLFLLAFVPMLLAAWLAPERGGASTTAADPITPKQIYMRACASCHGVDGRGRSADAVGFDVELPDFTDCSFATREPDSDWGSVVHGGGPVRVFDRMMPAFGEAWSEEDGASALAHVRSFCDETSWPRGELNMPRAMLTEKAFPEDEAVITSFVPLRGTPGISNKFVYEQRVGARGQLEAIVPFGLKELDDGNWGAGLGDVAFGTKWAVLHSTWSGSILSVAGEIILPTGNEAQGFGKGVPILEPFISYGQLLPWDSFLHMQLGGEVSTDPTRVGHEVFGRGALGTTFTQGRYGRAWSPMIEVLAARDFELDAPIHWDVAPQLQVTLSKRQHIMGAIGVRIPVTEFDERDTQVMVYLLWDWFDGSFTDGWW